MAKNTGRGTRAATQKKEPEATMWTRRQPSSGVFTEAKAQGGKFNQKNR